MKNLLQFLTKNWRDLRCLRYWNQSNIKMFVKLQNNKFDWSQIVGTVLQSI